MANVRFLIDGANFTDCIKIDGFKWKKYDLESENAGRTLDGLMHRSRIARKRQLALSSKKRLTDARFKQLANALDKEFVSVTYPDPMLGETTKTFYGTELEASIWGTIGGTIYWSDASFTLTER